MTLEESYGDGWNVPFHPDDRQRAWEAWQRATTEDAPYSLECRLRRADGAYRWWLIRGAPLRDADGAILKWFGTCTDIEEIKQARTPRLRAQRALPGSCSNASRTYVVLVDNESVRIVGANAAASENMYGYFARCDHRRCRRTWMFTHSSRPCPAPADDRMSVRAPGTPSSSGAPVTSRTESSQKDGSIRDVHVGSPRLLHPR